MEIKEELGGDELAKSSIPLIIKSYEDIFSSFDPRSYTQRAISDDFLIECKRATRDKDAGFELLISVPKAKRNLRDELKIRKRLREHFKKHHLEKEKEIKKIKNQGIKWVGLGFVVMAGILSGFINVENEILRAIFTLFEVPSWFLIWEGLSKIFIVSEERNPEHLFYQKMVSANIIFNGY